MRNFRDGEYPIHHAGIDGALRHVGMLSLIWVLRNGETAPLLDALDIRLTELALSGVNEKAENAG